MKLGLIGKSLKHSFSARYFQDKFRSLNLDQHQYLNCELAQIEDLPDLWSSQDWQGFNVTIPYKEAIIPFLAGLSADAQAISAVNTLVPNGDSWWGFNTDHIGFRKAIEEKWPDRNFNQALILGTGGASKAVVFALKQMGVKTQLVSRSPNRDMISYAEAQDKIAQYQLLVNTSPSGTSPNIEECPALIPQGDLTHHCFMDLIYNPVETKWLRLARQSGAETLNGYSMLIHQAEAAWDLWKQANLESLG